MQKRMIDAVAGDSRREVVGLADRLPLRLGRERLDCLHRQDDGSQAHRMPPRMPPAYNVSPEYFARGGHSAAGGEDVHLA